MPRLVCHRWSAGRCRELRRPWRPWSGFGRGLNWRTQPAPLAPMAGVRGSRSGVVSGRANLSGCCPIGRPFQFHVKHRQFAALDSIDGGPGAHGGPDISAVARETGASRKKQSVGRPFMGARPGPSSAPARARQLAPLTTTDSVVLSARTIRVAFAPPADLSCVSPTPAKRAPGCSGQGTQPVPPLSSGDTKSLSIGPTVALRLPHARQQRPDSAPEPARTTALP